MLREKRRANKENQEAAAADAEEESSPFAAISATMGWETFHMVQTIWLSVIDANPKIKDWEIQVKSPTKIAPSLGVETQSGSYRYLAIVEIHGKLSRLV